MRNLPYFCAICQKEFHNPFFLIKHVECRHPSQSRQHSRFFNTNIGTAKTNFSSDPQNNLSRLKTAGDVVSINVEISPNYKEFNSCNELIRLDTNYITMLII